MRVASLLPSATEMVHAVGRGDTLVLRSHECDHPPEAQRVPSATEPKYAADGTSYQIDERVKALVQEGLSVYRVDREALRQARPDIVITQDQCEVCAASSADVEGAVREALGTAVEIVSLEPASLGDVLEDVRTVGRALDAEEGASRAVEAMEARMAAVTEAVEGAGVRPTVAGIEWLDPLMAAGNWFPELVDRAGGRDLFGSPGAHSPWLEWEALREADPDVLVLLPCGFSMERTRAELPLLLERPGWRELRAVRTGRVHLVDGHHYFNRPGPRLADSVEILGEILHPGAVPLRHRGTGWAPLGENDTVAG